MPLVNAITEATIPDESAEAFVERTWTRQSKSRLSGPNYLEKEVHHMAAKKKAAKKPAAKKKAAKKK